MGQVDPAQPLHDDLQEIKKAAERSADLTRQLLAFARKQVVCPKVINLNDAVSGLLNMLGRLIGENIGLAWLPGHGLWHVKMDPSQLDQILANLVVNARDAITGAGNICIETANMMADEMFCAQYPELAPGAYVVLSVSDNGCGMDKATLAQVFEPFFTTKDVGKGTGLGLATVYGIVKQNNGSISAVSELGKGTTFTIYMPRHVASRVDGPPEAVVTKPRGGHETVLLVEDEKPLLNLGKSMLERQGYSVLIAQTPSQAIRMAANHSISLLVTDVVMPEMNGHELANRIHSINPRIKCLFMSGYSLNIIENAGVRNDGAFFIQKPFSAHLLAEKIREALDSKPTH
jgi:CheY-like chemotaxis protein